MSKKSFPIFFFFLALISCNEEAIQSFSSENTIIERSLIVCECTVTVTNLDVVTIIAEVSARGDIGQPANCSLFEIIPSTTFIAPGESFTVTADVNSSFQGSPNYFATTPWFPEGCIKYQVSIDCGQNEIVKNLNLPVEFGNNPFVIARLDEGCFLTPTSVCPLDLDNCDPFNPNNGNRQCITGCEQLGH